MNEHVTWFDYTTMPNINISMQVGDVSYYTPTTTVGGFSVAGDITQLGTIKDISLIDTTSYDPGYNETTSETTTGLVYANEAYIEFKGDEEGCGWGVDCINNPGIIRLNKSYKEVGIIPGMSIDLGVAPALDSTGTLTEFSNSIFQNQAPGGLVGLLFVKGVNPNGDDENEILIAQHNFTDGSEIYEPGEQADILPSVLGDVATQGLSKFKSLLYIDGVPQYELDAQFQNRPTRVRFSFDNVDADMSPFSSNYEGGEVVYPATQTPYDINVGGLLSPWYGKTKFWMVTTEIPQTTLGADIGDFQMFSKDNAVNMTSPTGYYAQAKIETNSRIKSEMFAIAVDGRESSK